MRAQNQEPLGAAPLAFALAAAFAAIWSAMLAANAPLIWEEAYFRLGGRAPALGYADLPAGVFLLAALSERLFGEGLFGARALSWGLGALLPFAVWFLAEPLFGRRQALFAGALSALIPPLTLAGAYGYPEAGIQILCVLFAGCVVRALPRGRAGAWWLAAGLVCALGLFYHYRFWLAPAGLLAFLLLTRLGREQWLRPWAWIGGAIALAGAAPGLIHNLQTDFGSLRFQLVERQDWTLWAPGALMTVEQALLVTPILFAVLAFGAWLAWRRWRGNGDDRLGALLLMALALWLPYALIALFDADYLRHWPLSAYALLCAVAPLGWARLWAPPRDAAPQAAPAAPEPDIGGAFVFAAPSAKPPSPALSRAALVFGIVLALAGSLAIGGNMLLWRWPQVLLANDDRYRLTGGDLEDWSALREPLTRAFAAAGEGAVFAAADQTAAVQMRVAGGVAAPAFMLDDPVDRAKRVQQTHAPRGESEADLARLPAGTPVVVALRAPLYLYRELDAVAFRERLCSTFDTVRPLETVWLTPGRKGVELYAARIRSQGASAPQDCAFFPKAVLEQPIPSAVLEGGVLPVYGVAAHPEGVARLEVLIDGAVVGATETFADLPGWRFPPVLDFDPAYPNVYWDVRVDFDAVQPGARTLALRVTTDAGATFEAGRRTIYVR